MAIPDATFSIPQEMVMVMCPNCTQPFALSTALIIVKRICEDRDDTGQHECCIHCPTGCPLRPSQLGPQLPAASADLLASPKIVQTIPAH